MLNSNLHRHPTKTITNLFTTALILLSTITFALSPNNSTLQEYPINSLLSDKCHSPTKYNNTNQAPIAINDDNITLTDLPVSGNLITNDYDPDSSSTVLSTVISLHPTNGTVVMNIDGTYTYSPNLSFIGKDQFEYQICDNQNPSLCNTGIVNITVMSEIDNTAINDPPILIDDENITYENSPVSGQLLSNDYDRESTPLYTTTITIPPSNGTVILTPSGQYTYTPNQGYIGNDQFTYVACDSGFPSECSTAKTYLKILPSNNSNKPPFAGDDFAVTAMNQTIAKRTFENDNDPDSDPFIITQVNNTLVGNSGATALTNNGSVTISPGGSYSYTPNTGYIGSDQFTYQICDQVGECAKATVYLIILEETCINIQLKVFLEGALSDYNGNYLTQMRTDLNSGRSILPGQVPVNPLVPPTPPGQPYNYLPFNYTGSAVENAFAGPYDPNIVDWILISFRTGIFSSTEFKRAAALVYKNGTIQFIDQCVLTTKNNNQVYVKIEHRNHMGIMTPSLIKVADNTLTWDFTLQNSYVGVAGFGQKEVNPGVWAMYAGDCDQSTDFPSYDINSKDRILWATQNGNFDQYLTGDMNMNGDVSGADKILWSVNNGFSSRVPR